MQQQQKPKEGELGELDLDTVDVRPKAQAGVWMRLLDPAHKPTGVMLLVRGTDCEAYQAKIKQQVRAGVERLPRKATEDENNAEFLDLQATLIVDWSGLKRGGQSLAYSHQAAMDLLKAYDWITEQVQRFASRRSNFLPGPSSSSTPSSVTSAS